MDRRKVIESIFVKLLISFHHIYFSTEFIRTSKQVDDDVLYIYVTPEKPISNNLQDRLVHFSTISNVNRA